MRAACGEHKISNGRRVERMGSLLRTLRRVDCGVRCGIDDPLRRVRSNCTPHLFRVRNVQIRVRKRDDGRSFGSQCAKRAANLTSGTRQKDFHSRLPASCD